MKKPELTKSIDKVIDLKLRAVEIFIKDVVEPLEDVGNPEKLIGIPYEQWTPEIIQYLSQIYGTQEPNQLSDFIFRKEYKRVKELEEEM